MRPLLARAINKNQLLILSQVNFASGESISSLLNHMSKELKIPLSTLKLNASILKTLNLITFGDSVDFRPVEITATGRFVLEVVGGALK